MKNHKEFLLWTLLSGSIIIILGCIWHFLNDWLGFISFMHSVAPINESVWEHLKLTLWPVIIVWLIVIPLMEFSKTVDINKALVSVTACMLCANTIILGIHYTLLGAFNIENTFTDISSYIIGILFGQLFTATHIVPFEIPKWLIVICWIIVFCAITIFGFFSCHPGKYPIFMAPQ
ncbi:MAG: DUF6512 family protein [Coprococcus sp.]